VKVADLKNYKDSLTKANLENTHKLRQLDITITEEKSHLSELQQSYILLKDKATSYKLTIDKKLEEIGDDILDRSEQEFSQFIISNKEN